MKKLLLLTLMMILLVGTVSAGRVLSIDDTNKDDIFVKVDVKTLKIYAQDGFIDFNISSTAEILYMGDIKATNAWGYNVGGSEIIFLITTMIRQSSMDRIQGGQ